MTSNLEYALNYAKNGFAVIPLQVADKKPCKTPYFSQGFKSATTDRDLIANHWEQKEYQECNIGLKIDGFLVLDIDTHEEGKNGFRSLEALENHFEKLPSTFEVSTPSGGKHYYFSLPNGVEVIRQINAFKGIDILTNGYVVAPPSKVEKGAYEFKLGTKITKLATTPDWLLKALETQNKGTQTQWQGKRTRDKLYTGKFLDELVAGAEQGGRNDWIMKMISKMLSVGADVDTIYRLILIANDNFLSDPLPINEINATFRSRVAKHLGRR